MVNIETQGLTSECYALRNLLLGGSKQADNKDVMDAVFTAHEPTRRVVIHRENSGAKALIYSFIAWWKAMSVKDKCGSIPHKAILKKIESSMKKCSKCKKEKNIYEFAKHSNRKDGLQSVCRLCKSEIDSMYYKCNRKSCVKRNAINREKLKQDVNAIKMANPCLCGEKDIVCLDFHHMSNKNFDISIFVSKGCRRKVLKEITKCVILCANCHRKFHAGRKIILPTRLMVGQFALNE